MRYNLYDLIKTWQDSEPYREVLEQKALPQTIRDEYHQRHYFYDNYFATKYKSLKMIEEFETIDDAITYLRDTISTILYTNNYKYNTLAKTTNLDYNPIWNVDGTTIIRKEGNDNDIFIKGAMNSENKVINSGRADNTIYGERNTSNINGVQKTTLTNGNKKTTNNNYKAPFDEPNTTTIITDSSNQLTDSYIDVETKDAVTNTNKENTYTDAYNIGSQTETITNKTDTYTDDRTTIYDTTETTTRQGNQGITSTQKLISEEREIAFFNVFEIIWADIIDVCFSWIWEE